MLEDRPISADKILAMFASMPAFRLVFLGLFAATWLIGGNIVVARHYRRMGKSPWSGLKSFAFPWKNFNGQEWLSLLALAVLSFVLLTMAGYTGWSSVAVRVVSVNYSRFDPIGPNRGTTKCSISLA